MSDEIVLQRKKVEELVEALTSLLEIESHYQFKFRFLNDSITIVPHAAPVVIENK